MNKTAIEWTDATWNPIPGCSRVSEGCRHCYAEGVAYRFSGPGQPYEGLMQLDSAISRENAKRVPRWNGQIRFVEEHLLDPLRWKKPRRIFVNSMSDLFHENVTDEMLDRIFAVMALCPQHTFQVLTKRPERMLAYLHTGPHAAARVRESYIGRQVSAIHLERTGEPVSEWAGLPLPNVWLGVSVEDQKAADERIPLLLQTPAAVRFLSCEPLLGPVDVEQWFIERDLQCSGFIWNGNSALPGYCNCGGHESDPCHRRPYGLLDWVIVGGESGPGARPMHPDWARSLRDQCTAAGVPYFFKQWGEWAPGAQQADYSRKSAAFTRIDVSGGPSNDPAHWLAIDALFYRVGKKAAGNLLDGREWQQFPAEVVAR